MAPGESTVLHPPQAMPKPKPPATPKRRPGRPMVDNEPMEVMSIRLPKDVVHALDEWAARLDKKGPGRVTRSGLILHVVRQAIEAEAAATAKGSGS